MLTKCLEAYLAVRRSVGFKLQSDEKILRSYVRFAEGRGDRHVRAATTIEWAAASRSPFRRERRLGVVRRLAQYARAEDPAHEVPPKGVFAHSYQRRPPYILTREEVHQLLAAAQRLRPGIRPLMYHTLFGLLACTGLRISEALALHIEDVTSDGLLIRETKFRKSRLVPLHPTTEAALGRYLDRRDTAGPQDDRVFISTLGRGVDYSTGQKAFRKLVRDLELGRGGRRPHIHDLRHTFTVRALERCPDGRDRAGRYLRALSTYLGHANIANTYWYFQATPQLFRDMADTCETVFEGGAS
jgi:integrase